MSDLIEILIEGVKKFGGEIIAAVLLAVMLGLFPSLRKIFRKKNEDEEVKQRLEELQNVMGQTLKLNAKTLYEQGKTYYDAENYDEALKYLLPAAEQGHADAQYDLGNMYNYGWGGVLKDYSKAVKWYRRAAEQGHADGQYRLGTMYYLGWGVPEDKSEAAKWYRKAFQGYLKAAEQGHAAAQCQLGVMYHNGEGVPKDGSEAEKWYRKAAEQGLARAQEELKKLGY